MTVSYTHLDGDKRQPLHAAILGEVKAGKSTLLNAFAGGDISPTNTTETTACILKITYGTDEEGCIYYKDGSQIVSSIESVYQTLSEHRQEPEFFSHIDYIVIKKNLTGLKPVSYTHLCSARLPYMKLIIMSPFLVVF